MPYWRLSSFYFFYFGLLGCISPYWGLFLDSQGMSVLQIAQLVALFGLTRIVAPVVWGTLADRTGKSLQLLRIGAGLCGLSFFTIFWAEEFWQLAIIVVLYGFFWAAVLPQFEVITLNYLKGQMGLYSKIRLWGSVGFIVMVWGLGFVFDIIPVSTLPVFMLILIAAIFLTSFTVSAPDAQQHHDESHGLLKIFFQPQVIAFFVACFLMQVSHGAYYTFFSLFLDEHGYSRSEIGFLWALGVIAEVIMFMLMTRMSAVLSMKHILLLSLFVAALRWYLTGHWIDSFILLLILQIGHAATFGSMHAVSMHYVYHFFKGAHQGKGQSLYSGLAYGAGSAVGAYYAGILWDQYNPIFMFEMSGLAALIGFLVALIFIKRA